MITRMNFGVCGKGDDSCKIEDKAFFASLMEHTGQSNDSGNMRNNMSCYESS